MMRILATILVLSTSLVLNAQDFKLEGRIISENFEAMPEVKITNICNELLAVTDIEGRFEITIPKKTLQLNIIFVGMEPTKIELNESCDLIEVILLFETLYDFTSLKRVDRLRMKSFKKIPILHSEAFIKGLFKTNKACYSQKFIRCYNKREKQSHR